MEHDILRYLIALILLSPVPTPIEYAQDIETDPGRWSEHFLSNKNKKKVNHWEPIRE